MICITLIVIKDKSKDIDMLLGVSFAFANIEPIEYNIPIFHNIVLALLPILALSLDRILVPQLHIVRILHDFGTDETFLEIGVDDACGLRGLCVAADCPASDFVFSGCEEVDEIEGVVACFYYFGNH